ncbi:MAG: RNA polymerase factor sigma-54 [Bacteroidales bacterium]|nr:RNA polymerase factor sigma-54 [Bacteroidales bacterium]MDD4602714.1 RNA polymerase factor sigma-54 [Bacteroidales bacterium]
MLNQKLQQRLIQKLSPQQVLVMRLLQEPILSLEQRIKQEIEENPALEETNREEEETENTQEETALDSIDSEEDEFEELEPTISADDEFTFEDYVDEGEIPEYRLVANNKSPDEETHEFPVVSGISFQDFLIAQIGMHKFTDKQYIIAAAIIGNLDESGYLRREIPALSDDLAFNQNLEASPTEILEVLAVVQTFDPPGIAARSLQECLLIQLESKTDRTYTTDLAGIIIKYYFDEFSKKHYEKILQKGNISEDELKEAIEEIQRLNPKPGISIAEISRDNQYIIPDFFITNLDGELELTLNNRNTPELILNREYINMLQEVSHSKNKIGEKAALTFVRQKLEAAKGFIEAIKQRQETLFTTMKAIMNYQREYFLSGDDTKLRPMILKDIATIVNLDISTVSRVANSKYVQTPFGTLLLKSLFSESMLNTDGEEISTREIKKILSNTIEAEDKSNPLTDDELMDFLKTKGYNIARRTIAKYRKQLNIPVARLRKEL